jgi:spermidine synthase
MKMILYAVFALSGAVSLAFETLWFRQAGLTFGNSVWASSLVLSSFMAGIALGNGLAARYAARAARPLVAYALLEVAIAISGVGLVWALPSMTGAVAAILVPFVESPWILNLVRLGVGFAVLLLPATAMGATLPLVVRELHAHDANFGSVLGRLYGSNTLGAMVGAVAGEAFLIQWLGIRGSAVFAGVLGLTAAAGALLLARRLPALAIEGQPAKANAQDGQWSLTVWCCLIAAFLTGGILLALEVVWFRFLHLFAHGGGLAFSLMLATVLLGIGIGGYAGASWQRRDRAAFRHGAGLAFLSGCVLVAVYWGFESVIEPYQLQYVRRAPDILWLAFCLTFLPSALSGVMFTLLGAALKREVPLDSRATGLLTLFNTVGAGIGSLCAGFVLLPYLGMERSFHLLSALYGVVGVLLLRLEASAPSVRPSVSRWFVPVGFLVAMLLFPSGLMERGYLKIPVMRQGGEMSRVIEIREDALQTIIYLQKEVDGEPASFNLITDGYSMSGTGEQGRRYMSLYVYWAVALNPDPKRALLISYGVGSTAKALTETASLEHIDIVDISRSIIESSETIDPVSEDHPLRDPRVQVHIDDGRYFLKTTKQSYDLITGEPPPPKIAGVVSLYTREYFQLVYDRLNPGGINTYWLPVHNLTESDSKAIIRAYCDVFSDCALWSGTYLDWMLTGSKRLEHAPSEEAFTQQWRDSTVGPQLRALGIDSPELMGSLFMAGPDQLRQITLGTAPLVDDFPKRVGNEFSNEATEKLYVRWMDADLARQRFSESPYIRRVWPAGLRERTLPYFDFQRMLVAALGSTAPVNLMRDLHRVLSETPYRFLALRLLGQDGDSLGAVRRLVEGGAPEARYPIPLGSDALANRNYDAAARHFQMALSRRPQDERLFFLHLYALCASGDLDRAQRVAAEADLRFPVPSERGQAVRDWFQQIYDLEF